MALGVGAAGLAMGATLGTGVATAGAAGSPRWRIKRRASAPSAMHASTAMRSTGRFGDALGSYESVSETFATPGARRLGLDSSVSMPSDGRGGIDEGIARWGSSPPSATCATACEATECARRRANGSSASASSAEFA